jgi:nucleotide-binding universal stress UspA family protein
MQLARRQRTAADTAVSADGAHPVMLVTFDVPFEPEATELAVDTAVESGQPLIIVNAAEVPLGPISLSMKYEYVGTDEVEDALRAPAALAAGLAVKVERLRLCSPRPIEALLELVAERRPGLLVVGPDRTRMRKRTYAKLAKKIRARAACLVWLAP